MQAGGVASSDGAVGRMTEVSERTRLLKFGAVGSAGYLVDAGLLSWLASEGLGVLPARAISFSVAVMVTFVLNRRFTFKTSAPQSTLPVLSLYWAVQIGGACTNFIVFLLLLHVVPAWKEALWLPLAAASLCAMFVTYTLSKVIFKPSRA